MERAWSLWKKVKDQRNLFLFKTRLSETRKEGTSAFMEPLVVVSPLVTSIPSAQRKDGHPLPLCLQDRTERTNLLLDLRILWMKRILVNSG